ncbi:MAG: hypothetical protein CR972_04855 [Candidatus Moraniibacteriota bacterium]|nr:MAG: hypothetical protein CR972_04855 [Candidatus Moranbacteria bacterium]
MPEKVNLAEYYKNSDQKPQTSPEEKNADATLELTKKEKATIEKEIDAFLTNEKEENENYNEKFDFLLDQLELVGLGIKRDEIEDALIDEVYENKTKTIKEACAELEKIIHNQKEKRSILQKKRFASIREYQNFTINNSEKIDLTHIQRASEVLDALTREAFEGKYDVAGIGMTAHVYQSIKYPHSCYKIITNPDQYKTGLTIKQEMLTQQKISTLNVNGVRTPKPYSYYMDEEKHLCTMEKMNAATLQEIVSGEKKLPKNFDIDEKFSDLRTFFNKMHTEYNIYHRDFHDKNIMFDLEDGTIYVIDFGKSTTGFGSEEDIYREPNGTVYPLTDEQYIEEHYKTLKKFMREQM